MLTPQEAAARLQRSPRAVLDLLRTGRLAGRRIDGRWHVDSAALEIFLGGPPAKDDGKGNETASQWDREGERDKGQAGS